MDIPITFPPAKAIARAFSAGRSSARLAAWAVRTLASVAAFMPPQPAKALSPAPNTKHPATMGSMAHPRRTATMATKTAIQEYSFFRNEIAPFWIMSASSRMRSPSTWTAEILLRHTHRVDQAGDAADPAQPREYFTHSRHRPSLLVVRCALAG